MQKEKIKKSKLREYTESLLFALIVAVLLRSFFYEPFKIPSDSLVPTLMTGDHIFVNKFIYGWRIPLTKKWFFKWKEPKRGEVIVFIYPRNESMDFIKRVVGEPGDKISIRHDQLYVNNEPIQQYEVKVAGIDPENKRKLLLQNVDGQVPFTGFDKMPFYPAWQEYRYYVEKMGERFHFIQRLAYHLPQNFEIQVPANHYFVMGDNRDNSADSREWGFVPRENLKGRAELIWLSWDHDQGGIRLSRFGSLIR